MPKGRPTISAKLAYICHLLAHRARPYVTIVTHTHALFTEPGITNEMLALPKKTLPPHLDIKVGKTFVDVLDGRLELLVGEEARPRRRIRAEL